MASKKRKRLRPGSIREQFIPHTVSMLESPAWCVLSLSALRVIHRIEIEHAHHGGYENGKLPVTYDHFHEYGIHRHAIGPAIREAEALGFIKITSHGCAGNAEWRKPNIFRLTYLPAKTIPGDGRSDDWKRITTVEQAEQIAKRARSANPEKQNSSDGNRHYASDGNHHLKHPVSVTETAPKTMSETVTTSIFLGEVGGGCGGRITRHQTDTTITATSTSVKIELPVLDRTRFN
jgi:hypothetical protein